MIARRTVAGRGQSLDCRSLLVGQVFGHDHVDDHQQVALIGRAPALHSKRSSRTGTGRDPDRDRRAVERGYTNIRSERRLGEGDRGHEGEIAAPATEDRVRLDVDMDEQIARRTAVSTRSTAPLEPDALLVLNPGGDADLDLARS